MTGAAGRCVVAVALLVTVAGGGHAGRPPKAKKAPKAAKVDKAPAADKAPRAADVERLGKGVRLYREGQYAAAQQTLAPLAAPERRLRNRDYVLFLVGQSAELTGDLEAAQRSFGALAKLPTSRFAAVGRARAADVAFARGDHKAAKAGYEAQLKVTPAAPDVELAVARFRLGEIAARASKSKDALTRFHEVFTHHPEHPLAERALERMKALDAKLVVEPADRVARARRLTAERLWSRALEELALVPADAPPAVRDDADYWIGTTHFKMRHGYDIAATKLQAVAEKLSGDRRVEALFHGARAWSRADQDGRAIAGYRDLVKRFPRARQAAEASFLIGWLDYNRGNYKEALPGLEATLRDYGSSAWGDDARWYHGLSRWLLGDAEGALEDFEVIGRRSGHLDGGKGRYWKGRALEKLSRGSEATATWLKLATDYPLTFYALQARARLAEKGVAGPPVFATKSGSVAPLGAVDEKLAAAEPAIARVDELLAAGMSFEAGVELDRAGAALRAKLGARAVPLLIDRYGKADNFFRPHRIAEAHNGGALRVDPHAVPEARSWWEQVYPRAYRPFVEKYAPTGNNPPYYLYTIMQKESAYNPHDVSYADAIGLLQMIPPTSRRVAARISRPYTDDVLYDPEGNIQFGAWYIGHLLQKFKGQIPLGAGSYNAGPRAMIRWLQQHGTRPLDEFIELCAYTQTREYMKKAVDIYARYLYLYEKQEWLPNQAVDAKYLDNDIDY